MKEQYEQELEELKSGEALAPSYTRRELIKYAVRTTIAIVLYVIFWEYTWVRWTLVVYVPLNLLSLVVVLYARRTLNKKIGELGKQIEDLGELIEQNPIEEDTSNER